MDKDKEASKRVKDKESGVARGIDFQFVSNVVNFDFPKVTILYIIPVYFTLCAEFYLLMSDVQKPGMLIYGIPAKCDNFGHICRQIMYICKQFVNMIKII